jgi:hypothetical protein
MRGTDWALAGVGVVVVAVAAKKAKRRGSRAAAVYAEEVASGSKPIEAVGTAVAAFLGSLPTDQRPFKPWAEWGKKPHKQEIDEAWQAKPAGSSPYQVVLQVEGTNPISGYRVTVLPS